MNLTGKTKSRKYILYHLKDEATNTLKEVMRFKSDDYEGMKQYADEHTPEKYLFGFSGCRNVFDVE